MPKNALQLAFVPNEEQRAFVASALAVGLPRDVICRMLPRGGEDGNAALDPANLDRHFADEIAPGPMLALRLIIARVLQRALLDRDPDALYLQFAVFRSIKDWPKLGENDEDEPGLDVNRLTQSERRTLRRLMKKAVGEEGTRRRALAMSSPKVVAPVRLAVD